MVSPQGEMFKSMRKALQHMVRNKFPDHQIDIMRQCFEQDGWETSKFLPSNWLFKMSFTTAPSKPNIHNIHIMTEDGEQLESYLAAIKVIEADPKFSTEDVEKINQLVAHNTNNTKLKEQQLGTSIQVDAVLPEGWKTRACGTQQYTGIRRPS